MSFKEGLTAFLVNFSNKGMVYFGHGICKSKSDAYIENLHLSTDDLISVIKFWKRMKVKFLSLDEVTELSKNKFKHKGPWVHFTFDDGYQNNLLYLSPIMEEYQIPFSVFITTDFIGKNEFLPSTSIRIAVLNTQKEITIDGIQTKGLSSKTDIADKLVKHYKYLPADEGHVLLSKIQSLLSEDEWRHYKTVYKNDLPLSMDELKKLSSNPYCQIGAHTHSHTILHCKQKHETIIKELNNPISELSSITNSNINSFAYPNGTKRDYTENVIAEVKKAGYETAFTTSTDFVSSKTDPLTIPRYVLTSKGGWIAKLWMKNL